MWWSSEVTARSSALASTDLPFAAVSPPLAAGLLPCLAAATPSSLPDSSQTLYLLGYNIQGDKAARKMSYNSSLETSKVLVGLDEKGQLCSELELGQLIVRLPLAADFHSCSVLLEVARPGKVHLVTSRPLREGEPLYLWFSTDIQAILGISFLSPANIRGEKNYGCHRCGEIFEYPNPLKVHLSLNCSRLESQPRELLWRRLAEGVLGGGRPLLIPFLCRLSLSPRHCHSKDRAHSPPELTGRSPSPGEAVEKCEGRRRPASEPPSSRPHSAFRPYPERVEVRGRDETEHPAARIEQLVSSLGANKQGHLCLYCGKVYSRKYGLKIHIRTHTGFKPLKCKYCLRPFGDPSNLNKHVRLHAESETPYRCEPCGKILVRKRDLERHLKSRHGRS